MADETNTNKREVCKPFSIKMYQEEIDRFKRLGSEMDGVTSDRTTLTALMDFFENPKKVVVDNPELISKIKELKTRIESQNQEITTLKQQLENTLNDGNESAMSAQRLQMELDKAQEQIKALEEAAEHQTEAKANHPENVFEVEVHPVAFHFLKGMAEKTQETPGYILTDLFIRDLQNPRANNLPYIVASSEIKAKLEEYKKAHPEEYQRKED